MKRTEAHQKVIGELQWAEHLVQGALNDAMIRVVRACPKPFHKTIMMEFQTLYLSRTIKDAFKLVEDRTDLFIPEEDLASASVALFLARFGRSTTPKKPKKKRSIKSIT